MQKLVTIKEVARKLGISEYAVKKNVENLLPLLPMDERLGVMEYLLYCKRRRHGKESIQEYAYKCMWEGGELVEST